MLQFRTELEIENSSRDGIYPLPSRLQLPPLNTLEPHAAFPDLGDELSAMETLESIRLPEDFGMIPTNEAAGDKASAHPPGMVRLVMSEVAQGLYDKRLVFQHLMHLNPGTAEFNAAYIEARLKSWDKARWAASKNTLKLKAANARTGRSPSAFYRWEVESIKDLWSLAGFWFSAVAFAQVAVAFYAARFIRIIPATAFIQEYEISDHIGSPYPWPFLHVFASLAAVFFVIDFIIYRRLLGKPIFRWAMPCLWLTIFSLLPAFICYLIKVFVML